MSVVETLNEIQFRGHSMSLEMVSLESLGTVSYSHSVAAMAVSLAISTQYTNVTDRQPARHRATARTADMQPG